jgi:hypothetical protein
MYKVTLRGKSLSTLLLQATAWWNTMEHDFICIPMDAGAARLPSPFSFLSLSFREAKVPASFRLQPSCMPNPGLCRFFVVDACTDLSLTTQPRTGVLSCTRITEFGVVDLSQSRR